MSGWMIILCTAQVKGKEITLCKTKRYKVQFRLSAHSEREHTFTERIIGFHNGPAEQEDDLKILKSLRKGETTYLAVWLF